MSMNDATAKSVKRTYFRAFDMTLLSDSELFSTIVGEGEATREGKVDGDEGSIKSSGTVDRKVTVDPRPLVHGSLYSR